MQAGGPHWWRDSHHVETYTGAFPCITVLLWNGSFWTKLLTDHDHQEDFISICILSLYLMVTRRPLTVIPYSIVHRWSWCSWIPGIRFWTKIPGVLPQPESIPFFWHPLHTWIWQTARYTVLGSRSFLEKIQTTFLFLMGQIRNGQVVPPTSTDSDVSIYIWVVTCTFLRLIITLMFFYLRQWIFI